MTARHKFESWENYTPPPDAEDYADDEPEVLPASFPVAHEGCFYGVAGEFAKAACVQSEAHPVGVLVHLLTWAGAYFGTDAALKMGNISAPPRLMAVIVSTSGGGKGTSAGEVSALMRSHINLQLAKIDMLPAMYRDGPMSSGEGLAWAVRDASEATDKETGLPLDPGITDKRLMILEEEFAAVLQAAKRQGNTITSAIRKLWDNGCYSPLTKHNPVTTTNAHVCFVGHITYDELIRLMDGVDYTNGFANRILWICINRPQIVPIPDEIPQGIMDGFAVRIAEAVKFASALRDPLRLSEAGEALWRKVAVKLARQGVQLSERARQQVLRIANIYALLDLSAFVEPAHLLAALRLWDYSIASLKYIFDSQANTEEDHLYGELSKHPDGLTSTEISVLIYQKHTKAEAINALLKALEAQGKITRSSRPKTGAKGRPSTVFKAVIA